MKLRYYFVILAVMQLTVWVFMLVLNIDTRSIVFYFVEAMTVLNVLFLFYFYRKVMKPIDSITAGLDLLKEQDFNSMLVKRGHYEADRIVDLFNTMLIQLRNERLKSREQNNFLNVLIECSPMGVVIMNPDRKIILANAASMKMLGVSIEPGMCFNDIDTSLAREMAKLQLNGSDTFRIRNTMIYCGSLHSFIDSGVPHLFYLIESLTEDMMKAEKNAYEKVIRIMAHEVNNTVAGVNLAFDTADSILSQMAETEDIRDMMRVCIERTGKMSEFITNLSNVVKIPEPVMKTANLNDVIERNSIFFQTFCNSHSIRLHVKCCEQDALVQIDVPLFEQVLQNIVKNAVESIEHDGDIHMLTYEDRKRITLEIADNGKGISEEVDKNLFSPFFTTKPAGQGVGLMFIREVLMRHHCDFSLRTGPDSITRFIIQFPVNS